jgi:hypothetical protein
VPAIGRGVDIKAVRKVCEIDTAAPRIDGDVSRRLKIGLSIRIAAHQTDRELICDAVIDADDKATGRKVVALSLVVIVNRYPVSPAVRPDAPTVFRCSF